MKFISSFMRFFNQDFLRFFSQDFEPRISSFWNNISPVSKKAFLWVFLIVNFVFAWHTSLFFPEDHSLMQIKEGIPLTFQSGLGFGRFGGGLLQQVTGGHLLPIFNNVFCYVGLVLAVIYLANYWYVPKTTACYVLFSLFTILIPYVLPWVCYIRHQTYFWDLFLMIFALTLLIKPKWFHLIFATILFYICLGTYLSMVQFILVAVMGRCLMDILYHQDTFKSLWKKYYKTGISILVASVVFAITLLIWNHFGGISHTNDRTNFVIPTFEKISKIFHSYLSGIPYLPSYAQIALLIPVAGVLIYAFWKEKWLAILLMAGLVLACQLTNLFSPDGLFNKIRILYWGTPWFYALFIVILLKSKIQLKNLTLLFLALFSYFFAIQDMRWQKDYYFETKREVAAWQDILQRIKASPNFKPDKKYSVYYAGWVDYRGTFSTEDYPILDGYLKQPVSSANRRHVFDFYEKTSYLKRLVSIVKVKDVTKLDTDYLLKKARPYPHPDSVYVNGSSIYIIFSPGALKNIQKKIRKQAATVEQSIPTPQPKT